MKKTLKGFLTRIRKVLERDKCPFSSHQKKIDLLALEKDFTLSCFDPNKTLIVVVKY